MSSDARAELPSEELFAGWSRRIRVSDRGAYAEVFQATHPALVRFAWRYTGDEQAARDVVQDAFLKLWQTRDRLDAARSLRALLFTMVRNLALNHNRARHNHAAATAETDDWGAAEPLADREVEATLLEKRLDRWVEAMPERRREAFLLSRLHGLSHEEIAQIMGLTSRTVNTHIVLALKQLRHHLSALEPDRTA